MDRDRLVSLQRWFDHSQTSHALEFCSIGSCPKLPNPRFGVATLMDVNRWRGVDLLSKDSNPVPNLARPAPADIDAYIRAEDAAFKGRNPLVCSAGHARSNGDDEKLAIWQDVIHCSVSDQVVDEFSKKAREAYEAWTGDYAPFVWQWLDLIRPLSVVNRFVFVVWRDAQRLDFTTGMLLVDVEETIQRTREQLAPDGIEICRIPVERWDDGLCLASSLAIAGKLRNSAVVAAIADISAIPTPRTSPPADVGDEEEEPLRFGDSCYFLWGEQNDLAGVPLQILKAAWESPEHRIKKFVLTGRGKYVPSRNSGLRANINKVRSSLRDAIRSFDRKYQADPLPSKGRGPDSAIAVELPALTAST